jgi:hypothetical protein
MTEPGNYDTAGTGPEHSLPQEKRKSHFIFCLVVFLSCFIRFSKETTKQSGSLEIILIYLTDKTFAYGSN